MRTSSKTDLLKGFVAGSALLISGGAFAIPALQLGPGGDASDSWNYGGCGDGTVWCATTSDGTVQLAAFANATAAQGGNGNFAWDTAGSITRYAYLVVSAVPNPGSSAGDVFDITVANDSLSLSLKNSGYGSPPLNDTNDLAPHGIFDSWFEIYEFNFDGALGLISDQQPGQTGTGQGYKELFDITVNTISDGVDAIHFDLFTVSDSGLWDPSASSTNKLVKTNAPFSHDAQWDGGDGGGGPNCQPPFCVEVPEPGMTALMGTGLVALGFIGWRRRNSNGTQAR